MDAAEKGRPEGKTPKEWAEYWTTEMEAARKRQEDFVKQGNAVVRRFTDDRHEAPFAEVVGHKRRIQKDLEQTADQHTEQNIHRSLKQQMPGLHYNIA